AMPAWSAGRPRRIGCRWAESGNCRPAEGRRCCGTAGPARSGPGGGDGRGRGLLPGVGTGPQAKGVQTSAKLLAQEVAVGSGGAEPRVHDQVVPGRDLVVVEAKCLAQAALHAVAHDGFSHAPGDGKSKARGQASVFT